MAKDGKPVGIHLTASGETRGTFLLPHLTLTQTLTHYTGFAAIVNYPLWRSSVLRQSGYLPSTTTTLKLYSHAFTPPYKGIVTVIGGMTWARAGIFYMSDTLKANFEQRGVKGGQGEEASFELLELAPHLFARRTNQDTPLSSQCWHPSSLHPLCNS